MKQPLELYRFVEGTTSPVIFTLARAEVDVVYNTETYVGGYSIDRTNLDVKADISKSNLDITLSRTNPVAQRYLLAPVDVVVTLALFVQLAGGTTATAWRGRLASVKATGQSVTLSFESVFTSMRRPGLRARYQRMCRHVHYGRGCNLNRDDWAVAVTVTAIDGTVVTLTGISGDPVNKYRAGMIKGPGNVIRFVQSSSTGAVVLNRRFEALEQALIDAGAPISATLYPGCNHLLAAGGCVDFDNTDNYGGFPWIPTKNPFGGSSIQ